ncbi:cell division protein ZapA [Sphingobium sp. AN558]|uniref:cell division protein ZapA n=1 Tax=Sphingobium sp. AN558 TaxID=3133442 RepID=UPI0030BA73F0
MAETTLHIIGRQYVVRCRDGEEAHLAHLASLIEEKARAAQQTAQGLTETRTLLFAALFLADEIADLKRQVAEHVQAPPPIESDDGPAAQAIEALAARIEKLNQRLVAEPPTA